MLVANGRTAERQKAVGGGRFRHAPPTAYSLTLMAEPRTSTRPPGCRHKSAGQSCSHPLVLPPRTRTYDQSTQPLRSDRLTPTPDVSRLPDFHTERRRLHRPTAAHVALSGRIEHTSWSRPLTPLSNDHERAPVLLYLDVVDHAKSPLGTDNRDHKTAR